MIQSPSKNFIHKSQDENSKSFPKYWDRIISFIDIAFILDLIKFDLIDILKVQSSVCF